MKRKKITRKEIVAYSALILSIAALVSVAAIAMYLIKNS